MGFFMVEDRGQFSSRLGFILAAAGSAVGLGNLVAFPVMASKNGGAAFLFVYLVFVALICYPVMLAEIAMAFSSINVVTNSRRLQRVNIDPDYTVRKDGN